MHSRTVCNFLNTHFMALTLSLPIMVTFLITLTSPGELISFLSIGSDSSTATWILSAIPVVFFIECFTLFNKIKSDLYSTQKKLIPQIILEKREILDELEEQCGVPPPLRQPEALNFHRDITNSDVFSHFDELPVPEYLESARDQQFTTMYSMNSSRASIEAENGSSSLLSVFGWKPTHLNRHEKLLGRFKISKDLSFVALQALQIVLSVCTSWTVIALISGCVTIVNQWGDVKQRTEVYKLIAFLTLKFACIMISFAIGIGGMPAAVESYTIATSVEMMKNREVISDVLKQ